MANKNFTQFTSKSPVLTSDFLVGYDSESISEFKFEIKEISNLIGKSVVFNEGTKSLHFTSGDVISLSALSNTEFFALSGLFVTNLAFEAYKTQVASATASLSAFNNIHVKNNLTVGGTISSKQEAMLPNVALEQANIQTYTTELSASSNFLWLNLNGSLKAIRLWDIAALNLTSTWNDSGSWNDSGIWVES